MIIAEGCAGAGTTNVFTNLVSTSFCVSLFSLPKSVSREYKGEHKLAETASAFMLQSIFKRSTKHGPISCHACPDQKKARLNVTHKTPNLKCPSQHKHFQNIKNQYTQNFLINITNKKPDNSTYHACLP